MSLFGGNAAIARQYDRQAQVTVGATEAAATGIDVRQAAGHQMIVPAGATTQTVAVYAYDQLEGTYVPLYNADGAVTISVVASRAIDLPSALFSCHYVKFVGTNAFTAILLLKG